MSDFAIGVATMAIGFDLGEHLLKHRKKGCECE
jgi:hypothetical protein